MSITTEREKLARHMENLNVLLDGLRIELLVARAQYVDTYLTDAERDAVWEARYG